MAKASAGLKVTLKCKNCGRTLEKGLTELKANSEFRCECGTTFVIQGDGFQSAGKAVDAFQKSIADLSRKLRRK